MKAAIKDLSSWHKRTTLERCLRVVSIFVGLLIIGLLSLLVSVLLRDEMTEELKAVLQPSSSPLVIWLMEYPGDKHFNSDDVCDSTECFNTAWDVLDKMNPAIEPCNDFYQFACGKFIENTTIPKDRIIVDIFTEISDKLEEQIETIIKEEIPTTQPKYLRLPNTLYKACMNTTLIERLGIQPIQQISDSLGGWPVVVGAPWDSNNSWNWQETAKNVRRLGFNTGGLLDVSVGVNPKNSTKLIINVHPTYLGRNNNNLVQPSNNSNNDRLFRYEVDYMVDIAAIFGAKRKTAEKELNESLQFAKDLYDVRQPPSQTPNLYNFYTIKELQIYYPYIQWLDYINAFFPKGYEVDENEVVNLQVPTFFNQMGKLLARTNKRVIANYMMWNIYESSLVFLTKDLRERKLQYISNAFGQKEQIERHKECVDLVSNILSVPVGYLYIQKYFEEDSKATALEMVNNIRDAFGQMIYNIEWMDDTTKQEARRKLHAMKTYVGYPDNMLDSDEWEKFYHKLNIDPQKYFESYLNIQAFNMDNIFSKLKTPMNNTKWLKRFRPAEVNAFYALHKNALQLPAGILQDPFFNGHRPSYMNYGAIGSVIGHEITHGFLGRGSQFNAKGQFKRWWQPDTERGYTEKAQCVVQQYRNYTNNHTGLNINGDLSQNENIADIGGVRLSYLAYENWMAENGEGQRLPGLSYTSRQMFWISFAQSWCTKYNTKKSKHIFPDTYSPNEIRALGTLHNMRDFSRDFQCQKDAPMNPVRKCEFW